MTEMKRIILMLLLLACGSQLTAEGKPANPKGKIVTYITCKIGAGIKHDTLSLVLNGPWFNYVLSENQELYASQTLTAVAGADGSFRFRIMSGPSPFHVTLYLSSHRLASGVLISHGDLSNYLIMPGSDIKADFEADTVTFSGKGAKIFEARYVVDRSDKNVRLLDDQHLLFADHRPDKWLKQKDSLLNAHLKVLSAYRRSMPSIYYSILRADEIGWNRAVVYQMLGYTVPFFVSGKPLTSELARVYNDLTRRPAYIDPGDPACLSPKYTWYLYQKAKIDTRHDRLLNHTDIFKDYNYSARIIQDYSGVVRDKLLAWLMIDLATFNDLKPEYVQAALAVMKSPQFIKIVESIRNTYKKGEPITDFGFKDPQGHTVHLADLKGKVLIVDVWFTGCGPCADVAKGLPHVEEAFKDRKDVAFVSVSVDKNKEVWLKSISSSPRGRYFTTSGTTYLYTDGTAFNNPFIKKYVFAGGVPMLLIIDKSGNMFSATPSRPVDAKGQAQMIQQIGQALASK